MTTSKPLTALRLAALACALATCLAGTALAGELPEPGDTLPELVLAAPENPGDAAYLGVEPGTRFRLADLDAKLILVEVIGVYCPQCHQQAPLFKTLHGRIMRSDLADKVKLFALAAGGYPKEVEFLRSQGTYSFPVIPDPDFAAHKLLSEPKTPFTLLVRPDGRVEYAHLGVIKDTDALLAEIRELAR